MERIHLQPLAIAYRRRNGLPVTRRELPAIAWYGDMDLVPHLAQFVRGGPIDVEAIWGEPMAFAGDRKRATATAEAEVRRAIRSPAGAMPRLEAAQGRRLFSWPANRRKKTGFPQADTGASS